MISRRNFLKAAGIALFTTQIPGFLSEPDAPTLQFDPLHGRVLEGANGLWSDSVIRIDNILPDGYQTPQGFIEKSRLQPMIKPATYALRTVRPPFTAEVIGATTVLRSYCSAEATPVRIIGHGGLVKVVDLLNYDGVDWYGVVLRENETVFWTPSAPLAPAEITAPIANLTMQVDRAAFTLTALRDDQPLFSVPIAAEDVLQPGEYSRTRQRLIWETRVYRRLAPFVTTFGEGLHIYGAYWHNRFGEQWSSEGIEVPPYVAKWIYGASQSGARVMIT